MAADGKTGLAHATDDTNDDTAGDAADDAVHAVATDPAALLASLAATVRSAGSGIAPGENKPLPGAPGRAAKGATTEPVAPVDAESVRGARGARGADLSDTITTKAAALPGTPVQGTPDPGEMPVDVPAETSILSGPAGPRAPLETSFAATLAAAAGGVSGTTFAAAADATPATGSLAAAPGSASFAPELGAQISTFVRNGVHHARLELNPAEMGPLTVQIRMDGLSAQLAGQAAAPIEVHLAAEHALTRQALEQSMPALASSLREAGLTLSGGGVFEQPRQPQAGGNDGTGRGTGNGAGRVETAPANDAASGTVGGGGGASRPGPRQRGVVDLVA